MQEEVHGGGSGKHWYHERQPHLPLSVKPYETLMTLAATLLPHSLSTRGLACVEQ